MHRDPLQISFVRRYTAVSTGVTLKTRFDVKSAVHKIRNIAR